jgi:DNA-binding NarL/FixJ family response regulator
MKRILIVDRDQAYRKYITEVLQTHGLSQIAEASTICQAKTFLQTNVQTSSGAIDLIMTGFALDDGNAERLIEVAKELQPSAKIILVTGYDVEAIRNYGFDMTTVDTYIYKLDVGADLPNILRTMGIIQPALV